MGANALMMMDGRLINRQKVLDLNLRFRCLGISEYVGHALSLCRVAQFWVFCEELSKNAVFTINIGACRVSHIQTFHLI